VEDRHHTIVALVQDRPGVLNRVASLFRRRGFNITSLAVGQSEQPDLSRMTFVVEGDDATVEQVTKQLNKLIEIINVSEISEDEIVARELALVKVHSTPTTRSEILQLVDIFRAKIVDVSPHSLIIEITGEEDKINALMDLIKPFGLLGIMRTGRVAMVRGTMEGKNNRLNSNGDQNQNGSPSLSPMN
jgi:acetolactate synthase-1/3 small subunit